MTWHSELIATIAGFLSPEQCAALVAHAEALGYEEAPITTSRGPVMRKDVRNNARVIEDDPARAAAWWAALGASVPPAPEGWRPVGLNERFRFYRYDVGQTFAPHLDGAFRRPNGERSFWTMMVYLADDCDGGETCFYDRRGETICAIRPRAGEAVLFLHPILHESAPVLRGRKVVLRTDVMYARVAP